MCKLYKEDVVVVGSGPLACRIATEVSRHRQVLVLSDSDYLLGGDSKHAQRLLHEGYVYCRQKKGDPIVWVQDLKKASEYWKQADDNSEHVNRHGLHYAFSTPAAFNTFKSGCERCNIILPAKLDGEGLNALFHGTNRFAGGVYRTDETVRSQFDASALDLCKREQFGCRVVKLSTYSVLPSVAEEPVRIQGSKAADGEQFQIEANHVVHATGRHNFETSGLRRKLPNLAPIRPEGILTLRGDEHPLPPVNLITPDLSTPSNGGYLTFGLFMVTHWTLNDTPTWSVSSPILSPEYAYAETIPLESRLNLIRGELARLFGSCVLSASGSFKIRYLGNPSGVIDGCLTRCINTSGRETYCQVERMTLAPLVAKAVSSCLERDLPPEALQLMSAEYLADQQPAPCESESEQLLPWELLGDQSRAEVENYNQREFGSG